MIRKNLIKLICNEAELEQLSEAIPLNTPDSCIIPTSNGDIVIKTRNEYYRPGSAQFEFDAMCMLGGNGFLVPEPITFKNGDAVLSSDDFDIIMYRSVAGDPVIPNKLNSDQLKEVLRLLIRLLEFSESVKKRDFKSTCYGDLTYVMPMLKIASLRDCDFRLSGLYNEMLAFLKYELPASLFEECPSGIVTCFTFNNLIWNEDGEVCISDLSNSYYGALINDIAICIIECSYRFGKFCKNIANDIIGHISAYTQPRMITKKDIKLAILFNCIRFSCSPLVSANSSIWSSKYYKIWEQLKESEL